MKNNEINIRDPFILPYKNKYYMYGTRGPTCWGKADGFDVYIGEDLENWEGPIEVFHTPEGFWADMNYWAPEVHIYNGEFYMFASFYNEGKCRGTQVLKSKTPDGIFEVHSPTPVTPPDWECLDGTLYVDNSGQPYLFFCHEWVQITDGTMCVVKLSKDLKSAIGEPITLFSASSPPWADKVRENWCTDGPFIYKSVNGELLMIWSSYVNRDYVQAISRNSGDITKNWVHDKELLFEKDGGHGMLFKTFDNKLMLALHSPNETLKERPIFFEIEEIDGKLFVK